MVFRLPWEESVVNKKRKSESHEPTIEPCPKVAVLIETSRGYGRGMLRGIVRYARLHGPWSFYITPGDFEQALPKMKLWGGSGIIARVETREMAEAIVAAQIPAVLVGADQRVAAQVPQLAGMSEVWADSEGAARIAAEHLLERGFEYFAYVGVPDRVWSERRRDAYCAAIRASAFEPYIYQFPRSKKDRDWEREQSILAEWIKELPKPVGLMACNDDRGRGVLKLAGWLGSTCPKRSPLSVWMTTSCFASSPIRRFRAWHSMPSMADTELLRSSTQLMKHKILTPQRLIVEPTHVVTRRSTDVKAYNGREVGTALGFIHRNRARNITVTDVAAATGLSRRNLEVKFRKAVGKNDS